MHTVGENAHVLYLLGYSYQDDRPVLVFEYCLRGDLLTWLRTNLCDFKQEVQTVSNDYEFPDGLLCFQKKESLQNHPYSNTKLSLVDLISFGWQISDGMVSTNGACAQVRKRLDRSSIRKGSASFPTSDGGSG